jgi:hypothetical protein
MRAFPLLIVLAIAAACDNGGFGGFAFGKRSNPSSLTSEAGGEVALADGGSLEFRITSEQYKRWDRARKGISKAIAAQFGAILRPSAPSARSIDEAVTYLESQPTAARSIENAGMSVRGFVVMTVALEQEMRLASGQPAVEPPAPTAYEFPQIDTSFLPPQAYPQPYPQPYPVDTFARPDTFRTHQPTPYPAYTPPPTTPVTPLPPVRDSATTRSPTIFRRDTIIRRDTGQRRDTIVVAPPRPVTPDTTRPDTTSIARPITPPDTLRTP